MSSKSRAPTDIFASTGNDQHRLEATGTIIFGHGWQARLAAAMGVTPQFISAIYRARSVLKPERRLCLADVCRDAAAKSPSTADLLAPFERYWRETATEGFRRDNLRPKSEPAAVFSRNVVTLASSGLRAVSKGAVRPVICGNVVIAER